MIINVDFELKFGAFREYYEYLFKKGYYKKIDRENDRIVLSEYSDLTQTLI